MLLMSAVTEKVLLAVALWAVPPTVQIYMAEVIPVEAVAHVNVKVVVSSTGLVALLLMVACMGTTAKHTSTIVIFSCFLSTLVHCSKFSKHFGFY